MKKQTNKKPTTAAALVPHVQKWIVVQGVAPGNVPPAPPPAVGKRQVVVRNGKDIYVLHVPNSISVRPLKAALCWFFKRDSSVLPSIIGKKGEYRVH